MNWENAREVLWLINPSTNYCRSATASSSSSPQVAPNCAAPWELLVLESSQSDDARLFSAHFKIKDEIRLRGPHGAAVAAIEHQVAVVLDLHVAFSAVAVERRTHGVCAPKHLPILRQYCEIPIRLHHSVRSREPAGVALKNNFPVINGRRKKGWNVRR